jgi:hypothetical protein
MNDEEFVRIRAIQMSNLGSSLVTPAPAAILPGSFGADSTVLETEMAIAAKPGQPVRVTIKKSINREGARKTLQRLFMTDKAVARPIEARSRNFKPLPKRRGGTIWTKRPNKLHLPLRTGDSATIKASPQALRDLGSVAAFVEVAAG